MESIGLTEMEVLEIQVPSPFLQLDSLSDLFLRFSSLSRTFCFLHKVNSLNYFNLHLFTFKLQRIEST